MTTDGCGLRGGDDLGSRDQGAAVGNGGRRRGGGGPVPAGSLGFGLGGLAQIGRAHV